jgi:hypothetical protein
LACLEILKTFSKNNNINWIWLRLFSVFGEKENNTWLFPSLIEKIKNESTTLKDLQKENIELILDPNTTKLPEAKDLCKIVAKLQSKSTLVV